MPEIRGHLDNALGALLAHRNSCGKLRRLSTAPTGCVDFSSNSYLSLSTNPTIQKSLLARLQSEVAASEESRTSGGPRRSILGSGGSRLLDGNSLLAESLETKIARFHGAEAALLFTSAYDANTGLLGCVPQPEDVIVYDELIHASVHEGMRASRASKKIPFAHDSISEIGRGQNQAAQQTKNPGLDDVLGRLSMNERVRDGKTNVFICIEGLYSMDGDVVLLNEVVEIVDRHLPSRNGYIVVDEAHSVGVFGEEGRGLVCQFGLEDRVWARVLGLGKAMGCSGGTCLAITRNHFTLVVDPFALGVVLCSSTTRSYLINYARSLIYTTSMPFTSLISIDVVYDYFVAGQSGPPRRHLETLVQYTYRRLCALCVRLQPGRRILYIREPPSSSPIIPVFTAYPRALAEHCQRCAFMVRPIVAPTVPAGSERVRICLHSENTMGQVDGLCNAVESWVRNRMEVERSRRGKEHHKAAETRNIFEQDKSRL